MLQNEIKCAPLFSPAQTIALMTLQALGVSIKTSFLILMFI
jgi:hypothetical protein